MNIITSFLILSCAIVFSPLNMDALYAEKPSSDSTLIMFWNLENFFYPEDEGTGESDKEFSPSGSRHWTFRKYYRKGALVAKSIMWIADKYGKVPDIIALAEIENRKVLNMLVYSTLLRKYKYAILHRDSNDHRGIDVALLWRKDTYTLTSSGIRRLQGMQTRDILIADMKENSTGRHILVAVNHFPSKFGGKTSSSGRLLATESLKSVCDSVLNSGNKNVVACGDFNDVPSAEEFDGLRGSMVCKADSLELSDKGTIRFEGKWDLIDIFWVSKTLAPISQMQIVEIPFLMVWDNVHSGYKPLRTFSGPRYIGGVSDHCPVLLLLGN